MLLLRWQCTGDEPWRPLHLWVRFVVNTHAPLRVPPGRDPKFYRLRGCRAQPVSTARPGSTLSEFCPGPTPNADPTAEPGAAKKGLFTGPGHGVTILHIIPVYRRYFCTT
ncbi:hypothetical protein CEUSTIGMA_g749.t1 [Chlamydomonas eustigma]|uniref:Uncharacterized protein n=1 Tax=Chlamydomonas eustigma TaxID=1157962 RepID=A0A250WR26_9CHLO|nr:hypothetical protein CEUSTIGMA_g749.t1 [Chlamydomonas eustigma]|eukprot:GAX73295.1 hypothetical protein CEUSTIGMA_g749.t1 [Chlamydomonas eustigma]